MGLVHSISGLEHGTTYSVMLDGSPLTRITSNATGSCEITCPLEGGKEHTIEMNAGN
jgi:hypothetical protein